ncbi:hypothetical protein SEVIR_8G146933v4 [Setaria viridis]|uniref:Glycosyl hydrolase family 38 C-terminal domain-containing protein n=1 Tax=Setaria viridis TaxID=4556 RepID=A0A4U6TH50_SETVI|nr:hypothetical protein SEVIR_8G146933v2 [Setaria viridis]
MATNKTFYTDSSGRDFIKRIRDYRSEWKIEVHQPIAGNYYPVNLGIYVEDGSKEFCTGRQVSWRFKYKRWTNRANATQEATP